MDSGGNKNGGSLFWSFNREGGVFFFSFPENVLVYGRC